MISANDTVSSSIERVARIPSVQLPIAYRKMLTCSFLVLLDSPEATCYLSKHWPHFFRLAGWPSKIFGRWRLVLAVNSVFACLLLVIVVLHYDWLPRVPLPPCGKVCWVCHTVRQSYGEDYEVGTIGYSLCLLSKQRKAFIVGMRITCRVASLESTATKA